MHSHPEDTIVALSSAPGVGARAIVRLSGPGALACASCSFTSAQPIDAGKRRCYSGNIHLPGVGASLPADLHFWPGPRTYTGQEVVELHTLSYYYEGYPVAYRRVDGGIEVLAVGFEEVGRFKGCPEDGVKVVQP